MQYIHKVKELAKSVFVPKVIKPCLYFVVLPALLFYAGTMIIMNQMGFTNIQIIRDTAQQNNTSSFLGFLSNIGSWLWISSVAISFFTVIIDKSKALKRHRALLLTTGILSLILAVDDFFMIHDRYINEYILYLTYAFLGSLILLKYHKTLLEIQAFPFLLACTLLALSIVSEVIDGIMPFSYETMQVFEEGFKFLGAATWLYFNAELARYILKFSK